MNCEKAWRDAGLFVTTFAPMTLQEIEDIHQQITTLDLPQEFYFNSAVRSNNLRATLETGITIIRKCWGNVLMTGPRIEDLLIVRDKLIPEVAD